MLPPQRHLQGWGFSPRRCVPLPWHKGRSQGRPVQRGTGCWVPEDKGTLPAPRTPVLNLVRPPLLLPTSRSSPARLRLGGRRTLGEERPPDGAAPAEPWVPGPVSAPVCGGGGASVSFQPKPLGDVAKTRRVDLAHKRRPGVPAEQVGTRTADVAGFSSPPGGVSSPAGCLKETWLKLEAGGGCSRRAQVPQLPAQERKIPPWAAPAPAGHSSHRRCAPRLASLEAKRRPG